MRLSNSLIWGVRIFGNFEYESNVIFLFDVCDWKIKFLAVLGIFDMKEHMNHWNIKSACNRKQQLPFYSEAPRHSPIVASDIVHCYSDTAGCFCFRPTASSCLISCKFAHLCHRGGFCDLLHTNEAFPSVNVTMCGKCTFFKHHGVLVSNTADERSAANKPHSSSQGGVETN